MPTGFEQKLIRYLKREFMRVFRLEEEDFDSATNFMDLGFDSILALQIRKVLGDASGVELESTVLFRYPSVAELANYLASSQESAEAFARLIGDKESHESDVSATIDGSTSAPLPPSEERASAGETKRAVVAKAPRCLGAVRTLGIEQSAEVATTDTDAIAVISMACRFPGAASVEEFWENLRKGVDSVREVPLSRWDWRTIYDPSGQSEGSSRSKWGGFIEGIEEFDPGFFHISPHEARLMDPQQRLFLEVSWETFERAGYRPDRLTERCGVFVGVNGSDYATLLHQSGEATDPHLQSGNAVSMVATRLSYLLNLRGPSLTVDTACSSALVAVHLACQSLKSGDAELAIAGGVNLILNEAGMVLVSQYGMLAGDGRCKAFDERADGFVRGEGAAAVLLKPLAKALVDGDQILGVLRGTAINNDGHSKAGLAAPNPKAQEEVVLDAHRAAGIDPESICYLEAHGTGTALGDPIELDGLTHAFGRRTSARGYCAIGSVKSNVGHLEAAAGIAGLIKAVLVVQHGELPPTLHVRQPNRRIRFEASPFFVNDQLRPWPVERPEGSRDGTDLASAKSAPCRMGTPRRAGVSAFGFGGTNVHAIIEQPPRREPPTVDTRAAHVLVLSATSTAALRRLSESYETQLTSSNDWSLGEVCRTANGGRRPCNVRLAIVLRYQEQLADKLELFRLANDECRLERSGVFTGIASADPTQVPIPKRRIVQEIELLSDTALSLIARTCRGAVVEELIEPWLRTRALYDFSQGIPESSKRCADVWDELPKDQQVLLASLLARLFVLGVETDWEQLYQREGGRHVLLPTYPFERRRYWVTANRSWSDTSTTVSREDQSNTRQLSATGEWSPVGSTASTKSGTVSVSTARELDGLLYQPIWRQKPWPIPSANPTLFGQSSFGSLASPSGTAWLIVGEGDELSGGIRSFLRSCDHRVIEVRIGSKFGVNSDGVISIEPSRRKHWRRLLATLAEWHVSIQHFVALWPAQMNGGVSASDVAEAADWHAVRLLRLVQAMLQVTTGRSTYLHLVTRGSQRVARNECVTSPMAASLWGFARSLELERPSVKAQCTDLEPLKSATTEVEQLIREWSCERDDRQVAFRDGQRFVLEIQRQDLLSVERASSPLRRGGIYLITGGLGGIGLAVARWLAEKYRANLVLAGRTIPPPIGERSAWLAAHKERAAWRRKLEWLASIEAAAKSVWLKASDVGNAEALKGLITETRERFGSIDAVFHTAGVFDDGTIETLSPNPLKEVLRPKLLGASVLDNALADMPEVPRIYFSSVAGLLGSPRQSSYAAANRGLDALASWQCGLGRRAVSIDWGLWGEVGRGVPFVDRVQQSGVLEPLASEEALAALERVLSLDLNQVIVARWGNVGWAGSLRGASQGPPTRSAESGGTKVNGEASQNVTASTKFSAVEMERLLKARLAKLLELDESSIARHQTFAELGLDSILVVQLLRELEGWLGRTFAPTLLRDYPNVAALAKFLARE
ncbi:MAG: SDR family NAD(P)-dependent oxidoreductase [Pirellulales bacterium]|nr:SDR family NAD(P)-dependent oxidoreductase [Pirellulales bacterium]